MSPPSSVGIPGIRGRLADRGSLLGTWIQMPNPEACEIAAAAGFDFVIVDMEHGSIDWTTAIEMIRATQGGGACPVVRINSSEPSIACDQIERALDAGASGVIAPMVCTGAQARMLASAARYPPRGSRGACPIIRATKHGMVDWREYRQWADQEIVIWGIIEHQLALDNIDEILSELDGVVLGPFDLAISQNERSGYPAAVSALREVAEKASKMHRHCVPVIMEDLEDLGPVVDEWLQCGCRTVSLLSDRYVLGNSYVRQIQVATDRARHTEIVSSD